MGAANAAGAYGFRLTGLDLGGAALTGVPADWPTLDLAADPDGAVATTFRMEGQRAVLAFPGMGRSVCVERDPLRAVFVGAALAPEDLAHPALGPAAAVAARWLGREVFHGGAFVAADGTAIAVLGARDAGKSTLLAALAARGVPVLADDLIVLGDGHVVAGPRTLDLRAEPSAALTGDGALPVTRARSRTRWRLGLPTVAPSVPLGGWVLLGDPGSDAMRAVPEPRAELLPAAARLSRIAAARGYPLLPSDRRAVLHAAAVPVWELAAPRAWGALDETVDLVLQLTGARRSPASA